MNIISLKFLLVYWLKTKKPECVDKGTLWKQGVVWAAVNEQDMSGIE